MTEEQKLIQDLKDRIARYEAFKITVDEIEYTFQEWMAVRTEELKAGGARDVIGDKMLYSPSNQFPVKFVALDQIGVPGGRYEYKDQVEKIALDEWILLASVKKYNSEV